MFEKFVEFLKHGLDKLSDTRIDALLLYIMGTLYFLYLHRKHDSSMIEGLKGENKKWESPEIVVYFWIQSFPFVIFADQFLGLRMSTEMAVTYNIILFFAIMGRAGVELVLSWKAKILGGESRTVSDNPSGNVQP